MDENHQEFEDTDRRIDIEFSMNILKYMFIKLKKIIF